MTEVKQRYARDLMMLQWSTDLKNLSRYIASSHHSECSHLAATFIQSQLF
jgi:hypothetical protein